MSSFLSVAKKLSATALSKQSPRLPIDWAMPGGAGLLAEGEADELAALIGMPDQPGLGPALRERHLQRVGDELGAHVIGHRPADDPAAVDVLHGDEVQPALPASAGR